MPNIQFKKTYLNYFSWILTSGKYIKKDNTRRAIDEQFVNLAVYHALGPSKGVKKNHKDEAYDDNSSISKAFDRDGRKVIEETMKMVEKYAMVVRKEVN